LFYSW